MFNSGSFSPYIPQTVVQQLSQTAEHGVCEWVSVSPLSDGIESHRVDLAGDQDQFGGTLGT
jgi:hypothetical protein